MSVVAGGEDGMVSVMSDAHLSQPPARKLRPGSGVPVDPGKLTWMRNNRQMTRERLSERIAEVARERGIVNNHGEPVTYSLDAIAKLENGERKPKMFTFEALCAALDCNPADLQEDFPGTHRTPLPPGMPPVDEVAQVLGDCIDPVDSLKDKLSTRAWNSVGRSSCGTVGELARASLDGSLEDVQNLGFVQLTEIRRVLATVTLGKIAADEPDIPAEAV